MKPQLNTVLLWVFCTSMFMLFLAFKLAQIGLVANWSWWFVSAPITLPLAMGAVASIFSAVKPKPKEYIK